MSADYLELAHNSLVVLKASSDTSQTLDVFSRAPHFLEKHVVGINALFCYFFIHRCDLLSIAGKSIHSEEETNENCLYRPTNSRFPRSYSLSTSHLACQTPHCYVLRRSPLFKARMLTFVALVAWSAVSVTSAMSQHIMSSRNDSSPWNTVHTSLAVSNADISSVTENTEEKVIALPEEFTVLGEWHLSRFKGLSEEEQKAEAAKLAPRIKAMNEEFSDLTRAMESRNIFAGGRNVLDWKNFVKSQYEDDPKIVAKVMFVMLASHFQGDDLASALVAGRKIEYLKRVARKMIDLQIEKWVELKKDPATVFELLQLHQTDVNPIKSLLFQKWVAFVQLRYPNPKKMADQVLLSILAKHFENNDDALCSALVAGTKTGSAKIVAERLLGHQLSLWGKEKIGKSGKFSKLLELQQTGDKLFESPLFPRPVQASRSDQALVAGTKVSKEAQLATRVLKCQVREWVRNESSEKEVFELLQIHQGEGDPFQRPLFFVWVNFVKLKYEKSLEEAEMKMFIFLEDYCKGDDLAKVLVAATKVDSTKLLAEQRLKSQIDVWVEERRDAASVFKLLELHQKSDNLFASPLFFTWVTFVRSRFSDDLEATKAMISTLRGVFEGEGDLVRVLAEGAKIERMKAVAETLQKALNEGSSKVLKRHDNDVSEPPLQKRQKIDLELPTLKRQHSFDLNDPLPEMESNLDLPPRED